MSKDCINGSWMKSKRDLVLYWGSTIVLLITFILMVYGGYLYFLDANPPVTMALPINAYASNGLLYMDVDICRYSAATAIVSRCYENDLIFCTPSEVIAGEGLGCYNKTRALIIPRELPNGNYRLIIKAQYQVNPLANRQMIWTTSYFNITDAKRNHTIE